VLIISTFEDELHILEAFKAGADGYVPKTSPAGQMIESIRKLHADGAMIPAPLLPKLLQGVRSMASGNQSSAEPSDMSPAELKILDLVKRGLQNKEVGRLLGITEKTVRNHLNNIFLKLDAKTRTEAIVKALQKGILTLED
jgi:DNA-binding NarL/FixJ family response regulator